MGLLPRIVPALLMLSATTQEPGPGISRDLARQRAERIAELRYDLAFDLQPGTAEIRGSARIRFELTATAAGEQAPLVLDFGGTGIDDLRVNGMALDPELAVAHDHLLLPGDMLVDQGNVVEVRFRAAVARAGTALTRYVDTADDAEYLYSLLVPADAHRLFPCFDQPDLRAVFGLQLTTPEDWVAVANGDDVNDPGRAEFPEPPRRTDDGRRLFAFADTPPLPTYLFAFAAGPFAVVEDPVAAPFGGDPRPRPMRAYLRAAKRDRFEAATLFGMHRRAVAWLGAWFDVPYPFGKLDLVLVPGFPYGGMEHAGAIFYRENALVFPVEPTVSEQVRRSALVYHEVAHQWFGNLVTMRWFDDLWLKEGFATLLGYRLIEELEPERKAWLRFLQRVKPGAYAVDSTPGTTPIYQELENLADAKSVYGAIVYDKAPAVLRELEERLGQEPFRNGLRLFVQEHAFGNAGWRDLVAALREAGGLRGSRWTEAWILGEGMPRVRAEWTRDAAGERIASFDIVQENAASDAEAWPLVIDVLLLDEAGAGSSERFAVDGHRVTIDGLEGRPVPAAVLLNALDVAYGQFLVDDASADWLLEHLVELDDPLVRAAAMSSLHQGVREAEIDPARHGRMLLEALRQESDPESLVWILGMLRPVLQRWTGDETRNALATATEDLLWQQIDAGREDVALEAFRFLVRMSSSPRTLQRVREILDGKRGLPGTELGPRDRFAAAASLLAAGDREAVTREAERTPSDVDVAREVYVAGAAAADADTKARYFEGFVAEDGPPEAWVRDALETFHWPGQESLTAIYLERALDAVEHVKAHRRIFFMPAWIDAFVNAHSNAAALAQVDTALANHAEWSVDVRRKVLQSADRLRRAVRIRGRQW